MKKLYILLLLIPTLIPVSSKAGNVDAYYGVNDLIDQGARLGNKDLRTSIAGIINLILGFLGVLAVLGIIFGGLAVMTSQGDSDQTGKGKAAIAAGVIGLAIVLGAFAISSFVLNELYNATR